MGVHIDHFKKINDTYGHDVGDDVLIHFTQLMKECVRNTDVVARTGGEEFLILFPHATLSQAVKLAEKIRARLPKNVSLHSLKLHETDTSYAEWYASDN